MTLTHLVLPQSHFFVVLIAHHVFHMTSALVVVSSYLAVGTTFILFLILPIKLSHCSILHCFILTLQR